MQENVKFPFQIEHSPCPFERLNVWYCI